MKPLLFLIPELIPYFITPYERGILQNCRTLRAFVAEIIKKRRE